MAKGANSVISLGENTIPTTFSLVSFYLFFYCLFIFETERGRERERERERERDRETQNPKQSPGSELSAQSPTWGLKHKL